MDLVVSVRDAVMTILCLAAVGLTGFAALDSLRRPTNLFVAVGRQTKAFWVCILAVALLIAVYFLTETYALSIFNLIGVIAAGVYLADVRPKMKEISDGRGSSGPYGGY